MALKLKLRGNGGQGGGKKHVGFLRRLLHLALGCALIALVLGLAVVEAGAIGISVAGLTLTRAAALVLLAVAGLALACSMSSLVIPGGAVHCLATDDNL